MAKILQKILCPFSSTPVRRTSVTSVQTSSAAALQRANSLNR